MNINQNNRFGISIDEFKKLCDDMIKVCQSNIDYVESSIKFYEKIKETSYGQEPSKKFKNKHKKWEEKIELLNNHIFKLYENIGLTIDTYMQLSDYKK